MFIPATRIDKYLPPSGFAAKPVNRIRAIDGELHELLPNKSRAFDRERVYGGLKFLAETRGYKRGWAWHKFKEYTGEFPCGLDHVQPLPPSLELKQWVLSRQIAWAKRSREPTS